MSKRQVTIEPQDNEAILLCPDCRGNNLYQRSIAIDRMFQPTGIGPISIGFECEGCDDPPIKMLYIYQHKGKTYLRWLYD